MIAAKIILLLVIIITNVLFGFMGYVAGYHDALDDVMKVIDEVFAEKDKKLEKEHTEEQKKY